MRIDVITTLRLTIRPLALTDAPFILELVNEPDFIRFIGDKEVRTLQDAEAYLTNGPLASYATRGHGLMAVELNAPHPPAPAPGGRGGVIGMCGIIRRDKLPGPDLGYAFLARYGGQGYAFEAAEAIVASHSGPLYAICDPDNARSIRLLERLAFVYRGVSDQGPGREATSLYGRP